MFAAFHPGAGGFVVQGNAAFDLVWYNRWADTFLYFPLAQNWSGRYVLPVILNAPIEVVARPLPPLTVAAPTPPSSSRSVRRGRSALQR